ncbi:hypothetical protein M514_02778, partial [Trichuris suis]
FNLRRAQRSNLSRCLTSKRGHRRSKNREQRWTTPTSEAKSSSTVRCGRITEKRYSSGWIREDACKENGITAFHYRTAKLESLGRGRTKWPACSPERAVRNFTTLPRMEPAFSKRWRLRDKIRKLFFERLSFINNNRFSGPNSYRRQRLY